MGTSQQSEETLTGEEFPPLSQQTLESTNRKNKITEEAEVSNTNSFYGQIGGEKVQRKHRLQCE